MLLSRPWSLLPLVLIALLIAVALALWSITPALAADTTPPTAVFQFDPGSRGVQVFGRDEPGGSGLVNAGPIAPICTASAGPRSCVYRVVDLAGNSLTVTLRLQPTLTALSVRVLTVQASGQPARVPLTNAMAYTFPPATDALTYLVQDASITTPPLGGTPSYTVRVRATWPYAGDTTRIERISPPGGTVNVPGLALVRIVAAGNGRLVVETSP